MKDDVAGVIVDLRETVLAARDAGHLEYGAGSISPDEIDEILKDAWEVIETEIVDEDEDWAAKGRL